MARARLRPVGIAHRRRIRRLGRPTARGRRGRPGLMLRPAFWRHGRAIVERVLAEAFGPLGLHDVTVLLPRSRGTAAASPTPSTPATWSVIRDRVATGNPSRCVRIGPLTSDLTRIPRAEAGERLNVHRYIESRKFPAHQGKVLRCLGSPSGGLLPMMRAGRWLLQRFMMAAISDGLWIRKVQWRYRSDRVAAWPRQAKRRPSALRARV